MNNKVRPVPELATGYRYYDSIIVYFLCYILNIYTTYCPGDFPSYITTGGVNRSMGQANEPRWLQSFIREGINVPFPLYIGQAIVISNRGAQLGA